MRYGYGLNLFTLSPQGEPAIKQIDSIVILTGETFKPAGKIEAYFTEDAFSCCRRGDQSSPPQRRFAASPEGSLSNFIKGKVYLVGAGPGDPELLTIKACRILGQAQVVLHDDLVNPQILDFASPSANIQNVGKRCGRPHISQEEIHSKMIKFATQGLTVVRLKGGDPLLYGRAGEEMEALRHAGIDFEIVPGVTAAFGAAASARIPLTDRRIASKVLLMSNRLCTGQSAPVERNSISGDTTVVIYMPGADYGELAMKFCAAGFDPQTCCLVVSCATSQQQQIHRGTLEKLATTAGLPAPALLIIGGVAGHYSSAENSAKGSDISLRPNIQK